MTQGVLSSDAHLRQDGCVTAAVRARLSSSQSIDHRRICTGYISGTVCLLCTDVAALNVPWATSSRGLSATLPGSLLVERHASRSRLEHHHRQEISRRRKDQLSDTGLPAIFRPIRTSHHPMRGQQIQSSLSSVSGQSHEAKGKDAWRTFGDARHHAGSISSG